MKKPYTFWVLGGDMRQVYLSRLLRADGHSVATYATGQTDAADLDGLTRADCVIFPLPVCSAPGLLSAPLSGTDHPIDPLLARLHPGQLLCGGRPDSDTLSRFAVRGLALTDYFALEELTVSNAIPTAEGAVQLAMEHLPVTIHDLPVLVLGYGRVGRVTARRFAALGAAVTVAARRPEQQVWAQTEGVSARPLPLSHKDLEQFGLVVNTVPAPVLDRDVLTRLSDSCLIIDLASAPGGLSPDCRSECSARVIHALALPGKVAPMSAAGYIRDAVYRLLAAAENNP
ncbi:MAG: dipicolinate synthase [Oscillospiraceae bacterium]|nr:dipicolinate synthase [Oscillospiraceae bacterium]